MKTQENAINNITKHMNRKVGIVVAVAAALVGVGGSVLAYGPSRPTYTIEQPADHITFNSITNNSNYGDERNFVLIKDAANTSAGGWSDEVNVQDGKDYIVRMYVHNNAAQNLNLVAQNVRASVNVPTTTGTSVQIDGFITADNASPKKVWDDVVLKSDKKFNIAYVAGSAEYVNNANPNPGFKLADSIVTNTGAQLGYEQMDGKIPGCFKYSGIVTFKVKVQGEKTPDFEAVKKVRVNGTSEWQKTVAAQPGQKVEYLLTYRNTGDARQNNVVLKDKLPSNVTYNLGSSKLQNGSNPNGIGVSDRVVTTSGMNIGNYEAKAAGYVTFTATLPDADKLVCGANTLRNTVTISTDNGVKSDTADVTVAVKCAANECKPGIPAGDTRCGGCTPGEGQVVDENGNCVTTPGTLPTTGPAETIMTIIGVGAMTAGFVYWYRSRQNLKKALAGAHFEEIEAAHNAPKLLKARTSTHRDTHHTHTS